MTKNQPLYLRDVLGGEAALLTDGIGVALEDGALLGQTLEHDPNQLAHVHSGNHLLHSEGKSNEKLSSTC